MNQTYNEYFNDITANLNIPSNNPCYDSITNTHDINCIYNSACTQFNEYFINTGIGLIVSYFVIQYTLRWFLNKGYKYMKPSKVKIKLEDIEFRYYVLDWVTGKQIWMFIIYILVLISLTYLKAR